MKHSLRFFVSAVVGTGLILATLISAATAGIEADWTVLGFALLVIYGLVEITILSYSLPPQGRMRPVARAARPKWAPPASAKVQVFQGQRERPPVHFGLSRLGRKSAPLDRFADQTRS